MTAGKTKTVTAKLTPTEEKKRINVKVKIALTENIIFIGSEMYYDSFWLKMMFIAAAYRMAHSMRKADRIIIAYVDEGYTYAEKLSINQLGAYCEKSFDIKAVEIKKITASSDITSLLNRERDKYKLLDVFFSSHGLTGSIDLNYRGSNQIRLDKNSVSTLSKESFSSHGRIFSYACRTGISAEDYGRGFTSETEAKPEKSLAQLLADHLKIEVHAFLRRTFYGNVLRDPSHSKAIAESLVSGRKILGDNNVIDIPPEHEGLPHNGLADGSLGIPGQRDRSFRSIVTDDSGRT
jgi:hypothetical protein